MRPAYTPLPTKELTAGIENPSPQDIYAYQRKVGSILYAATMTRPDVACMAGKLSEFLQNPSPQHQGIANQAITYLYGTHYYVIEFSLTIMDEQVFTCMSDAAFADDPATWHSTEGYLFQLYGGPIDWKSTKQKTVTTSSTEAELLALSHAAKEVLWWKRFFPAISFDPNHNTAIACDNQQTICLLTKSSSTLNTKLRHIDVHRHWLRQEIKAGNVQLHWIGMADMPADRLTKKLPRQRHEAFVHLIGLVDVRDKLEKKET